MPLSRLCRSSAQWALCRRCECGEKLCHLRSRRKHVERQGRHRMTHKRCPKAQASERKRHTILSHGHRGQSHMGHVAASTRAHCQCTQMRSRIGSAQTEAMRSPGWGGEIGSEGHHRLAPRGHIPSCRSACCIAAQKQPPPHNAICGARVWPCCKSRDAKFSQKRPHKSGRQWQKEAGVAQSGAKSGKQW